LPILSIINLILVNRLLNVLRILFVLLIMLLICDWLDGTWLLAGLHRGW